MYAISNNYKNYINSSLSRTPKSKVVIDGVEYLDNVLMSTPSISHNNETFIGGFPSKTCTFEIKDESGTLFLNNKWITVYRGLDINGTIEWIPMGIFRNLNNEDITTNKTTKTITFKGYDKRQLLDDVYFTNLDWNNTHTGLEIVLEVCSRVGLELESENFNFANYVFTQRPNFPSDATYTEVISRIAEIGGEMALITREGKVHIKGPTATNVTITKGKRVSLAKENVFGPITTLVLGNEGYDNDIVYTLTKNKFNKNGDVAYTNGTSISVNGTTIRATAQIAGTYLSSAILVPKDNLLNKTVTLSATVTPSASNDGVAILYWLNSNYEPSSHIVPINSTSNSYTYSIDSVPDGAEHLAVLLYSNYTSANGKAGDYVDYDKIQLEIGETATEYTEYTSNNTEWRIEDNPYVELIRQDIITDIVPFIIGRSIIPFELNECIDDYYLDLNDIITIVDIDDTTFTSNILSYDTSTRTKSNIKTHTQDETLTNYQIAGGVKSSLNKVLLEVDHTNNQIRSLVQTTDDLTTKTSETIQNAEEHTQTFYEDVIKEQLDELSGALNQEIETRSAAVRTSMDDEGNIVVHLGASSSPYTLETKNNGLYIYQNGELLQYLQGSFANIPNLKVEQSLEFSPLAIKKSSSGRLIGVRAGDE